MDLEKLKVITTPSQTAEAFLTFRVTNFEKARMDRLAATLGVSTSRMLRTIIWEATKDIDDA